MRRNLIGPPRDICYGIDNFCVIPGGGELGLARMAGCVPVAASRTVTVEYVRGPLGAQANPFRRRPVGGVYLLPAAAIPFLVGLVGRPVVRGGSQHLVVLRASPRFHSPDRRDRLDWPRRKIASGSFGPEFSLG